MDDCHPESVSTWIGKTRHGDPVATQRLWDRYFQSLANYVRRHLPANLKQMADEEDVAISTFQALVAGFGEGRFPDVQNRDDLWRLLTLIAKRKAINHVKHETLRKRSNNKKCDGSKLDCLPVGEGLPTQYTPDDPAWLAEFSELCRMMFDALPNDRIREIASMRLARNSIQQIATHFNVSCRTIERKLGLIRDIWIRANQ